MASRNWMLRRMMLEAHPQRSAETRGHLTTGNAKFYARQLQELLATAPQKTM